MAGAANTGASAASRAAAGATTIPWIDDDPQAWEEVQITPNGSAQTFAFLCRWKGRHDTKIDQRQALDRPGGRLATRGRKGFELDFELVLDTPAALQNFQSLMGWLTGKRSTGKLLRHKVQHPSLDAAGLRQDLFYKAGTLPTRPDAKGFLTSTLSFLENLPPSQQPAQAGNAANLTRATIAAQQGQSPPASLSSVFVPAAPASGVGGTVVAGQSLASGAESVSTIPIAPFNDPGYMSP